MLKKWEKSLAPYTEIVPKAPLSYTVLLTVGDMYATDDLGLILLLWWRNL